MTPPEPSVFGGVSTHSVPLNPFQYWTEVTNALPGHHHGSEFLLG